jgi:hypothetical protein
MPATQRSDPRTEPEKATDLEVLRRQYDASSALQSEFGDFNRFRAYVQAKAEGRAKLHRAGGVRGDSISA